MKYELSNAKKRVTNVCAEPTFFLYFGYFDGACLFYISQFGAQVICEWWLIRMFWWGYSRYKNNGSRPIFVLTRDTSRRNHDDHEASRPIGRPPEVHKVRGPMICVRVGGNFAHLYGNLLVWVAGSRVLFLGLLGLLWALRTVTYLKTICRQLRMTNPRWSASGIWTLTIRASDIDAYPSNQNTWRYNKRVNPA